MIKADDVRNNNYLAKEFASLEDSIMYEILGESGCKGRWVEVSGTWTVLTVSEMIGTLKAAGYEVEFDTHDLTCETVDGCMYAFVWVKFIIKW